MSIINENIAANKGIFVSSNLQQQQQKTNELLKLYYRDKKEYNFKWSCLHAFGFMIYSYNIVMSIRSCT